MEQKFTAILEKENFLPLISFLKSLTPDQRKQLVPVIKKLSKEYFATHEVTKGYTTWIHTKATPAQADILRVSSFVCMNRADFDKIDMPSWTLEPRFLDRILDWYAPTWLSEFINEQVDRESVPRWITYKNILAYTEKGYMSPSRETFAHLLVEGIFNYNDKKHIYEFKPGNLLEKKITLQEHIWYLFETDTNLHYNTRFKKFSNATPEEADWINVFKKLLKEKRIDRSRVIRESLLAANRNYNKLLSGWFADLFTSLEASVTELLSIQKELFSVLNAPHSKPVNTALQAIKIILSEKGFDSSSFLDVAPALLASDTKATVIAVMGILEKLVKQSPNLIGQITRSLCHVFIQTNEDLQTKASKLIVKYGDKEDALLRQELADTYPNILHSSRKLLTDFLVKTKQSQTKTKPEPKQETKVTNDNRVVPIQFPVNLDDLVFLASQVLDNNEPWHMEVLAAALVQYRPALTAKDLPRFEPAFQRALNLLKNRLNPRNGNLDVLFAMFIVDFGHWVIKTFGNDAAGIQTLFRKYDTKKGEEISSWLEAPEGSSYTAHWTNYKKIPVYKPHQAILVEALNKINTNNDYPLLSTPTNAHGWISPSVLVDRLYKYQQSGQPLHDIDLQVAIARCHLTNNPDDYNYATKKLTGELKELMLFLLDEKAEPKKPFSLLAAWLVASLTKKEKKQWPQFKSFPNYAQYIQNYIASVSWESSLVEYNYQKVKEFRKRLNVVKDNSTQENPFIFYDMLVMQSIYLDCEHNDIKRLLSLVPNHPSPLVAEVINLSLYDLYFLNEGDKKLITAVLQVLYETWHNPGEIEYIFLGTCLLNADKTIINIAGEIWLKAMQSGQMDNAMLGKVIGLHERIEFAPLKRFTDLATQTLFRVSDNHNRGLELLITHMLLELPDEPIKNQKKLLEIYKELLSVNQSSTAPSLLQKLSVWQKNAGLKSIAGSLIKG